MRSPPGRPLANALLQKDVRREYASYPFGFEGTERTFQGFEINAKNRPGIGLQVPSVQSDIAAMTQYAVVDQPVLPLLLSQEVLVDS